MNDDDQTKESDEVEVSVLILETALEILDFGFKP
jgi:hypothetical protein